MSFVSVITNALRLGRVKLWYPTHGQPPLFSARETLKLVGGVWDSVEFK